jgi:rhodanese-related sulfurtransferase
MGLLDTVSDVVRAIQLDLESHKVVLRFDRDTALKNVASFADLGQYEGKGFLVRYEDSGGRRRATAIVGSDLSSTLPAHATLSKAAFKAALEDPSVTVLDVRPTPLYEEAHVRGAASMPATAVADWSRHLPADRGAPVVLYGAGDCLGPTTWRRVGQLGYTNVQLYAPGFADWSWTEPGITTARWLRRAVEEGNAVVVIDVRTPAAAAASHIRGAVNIPLADLTANRWRFPAEAAAPIVVYGQGSDEAARQLLDWGYRAVRVLPMDYPDWVGARHPVAIGPTPRDIVYTPKPEPGAIARGEFVRLARNPRDDVVLVDLRDPIEISEPAIAHVVNIPFDSVPDHMATLTRGPEPVFFCPTGARAEMAYNLVRQADGESRFLASGAIIGRDGELKTNRPWWAP